MYTRLQPYTPARAWKRVINALLYLLTFLSSSMNSLLYANGEGRGPLLLSAAEARYALGVLPPAFALVLLALLLWSWCSALLHSKTEGGGEGKVEADAVLMLTSPLQSGRGAQASRGARSPHKGASASALPLRGVLRPPPPPPGKPPAGAMVSFADTFAAQESSSPPPPPPGAPPAHALVSFTENFSALPTQPLSPSHKKRW